MSRDDSAVHTSECMIRDSQSWIRIQMSQSEYERLDEHREENGRKWQEYDLKGDVFIEPAFVTTGKVVEVFDRQPDHIDEFGIMNTICPSSDLTGLNLKEDVIFIMWPEGCRVQTITPYVNF